MSAALTKEEKAMWAKYKFWGYKVVRCHSLVMRTGFGWCWKNPVKKGPTFQSRQAAIRDCISKASEAFPVSGGSER